MRDWKENVFLSIRDCRGREGGLLTVQCRHFSGAVNGGGGRKEACQEAGGGWNPHRRGKSCNYYCKHWCRGSQQAGYPGKKRAKRMRGQFSSDSFFIVRIFMIAPVCSTRWILLMHSAESAELKIDPHRNRTLFFYGFEVFVLQPISAW